MINHFRVPLPLEYPLDKSLGQLPVLSTQLFILLSCSRHLITQTSLALDTLFCDSGKRRIVVFDVPRELINNPLSIAYFLLNDVSLTLRLNHLLTNPLRWNSVSVLFIPHRIICCHWHIGQRHHRVGSYIGCGCSAHRAIVLVTGLYHAFVTKTAYIMSTSRTNHHETQ